jgi:hypothetical protein
VKHLFWIICGVLCLGILGAWYFVVPADEAREAKQKLDDRSGELKRLDTRAKNGDPKGVFDAEVEEQTKALQDDYLITDHWRRVLEPHVKKYESQLEVIQAHLVERSQLLHRPVAATSAKLEWYETYMKASEALAERLMKAGVAHVELGPDGTAPPMPNVALRTSLGLHNRGIEFPDPKEHPLITTRLRILELLADVLCATRAAIPVNPVVGPRGTDEDRARSVPHLMQLQWSGEVREGVGFTSPIEDMVPGRHYALRLNLQGTLASLLATQAALEANPDPAKPLLVVTSARLARKAAFGPGERLDAPAEQATLDLELSVLDFTKPQEANP